MGSLKALLIAGGVALAATSVAKAADLLPPAPAVEPAPAPAEFSGWYLRGDIGIGVNMTTPKLKDTPNPLVGLPADAFNSFSNPTISGSGLFDIGVGYQFNNWFHADITGEYRTSAAFHAIESYTPPTCPFSSCYDDYNGSVKSIVGLVNGYVDLGTWWGFTPYIGAGVGVADNIVGPITDIGTTVGGYGFSSSHSSTNLAWAAMAGIGYSVTPNLKLEMGWRYLDMGTATAGAISCTNTPFCGHEVQKFHLTSNDIRIGMRWIFAEMPPPPPALPLVRKY
jgi:opacity protein-like surface antigen